MFATKSHRAVLAVRLAAAASFAALAGCQGMYIHNADRAAVATSAKKSIDTVDVASISKTEQENLSKLLAEEVKAIDNRSRLVATLAVLDLAASDQSIAKQYRQALTRMEIVLHAKSMAALKDRSDCLIRKKSAASSDTTLKKTLVDYGVQHVAACSPNMPASLQRPEGLTSELAQEFDRDYTRYVSNCKDLTNVCENVGAITELEAARKKLVDEQSEESVHKKALEKARAEYQALVKANQDRTKAAGVTEEQLRAKAKSVVDAVDRLAKASPPAANQVKGSALVDLLTAAAGAKADSTDPDSAAALEIAKSIPSLAESVETARAQKAKVPVSHLLLALNNLIIQAERDERLRALDAEEVAVIERKVEALDAQAQLWRRYSDNLCNLVLLKAGRGHPGKSCDTIGLPDEIPDAPGTLACAIRFSGGAGEKPVVVNDCILGKSWRALFEENMNPREARALHEAAAAYLHARLIAYSGTIQEFRRIDVGHRRTVVRSEAALQQWRNLVSVPANELEGYYGGGIKPAELSDLIVKALGFTAIAIGAAQ